MESQHILCCGWITNLHYVVSMNPKIMFEVGFIEQNIDDFIIFGRLCFFDIGNITSTFH